MDIKKNIIYKKSYKGGIKINNEIIALTSNGVLSNGEDKLIFYNIDLKKIIFEIDGYSFTLSQNNLSLINIMTKYKKIESAKIILLCACKKYNENQNNGILLITLENNSQKSHNFYDTGNFEVYCFCPISFESNINYNIFNKNNKIEDKSINYILVGGFNKFKGEGVIKLFRIFYNKEFEIEYLQDIIFTKIIRTITQNTFDGFKSPINCIIQSRIKGNILISSFDGNVYLFSEPNINGIKKLNNNINLKFSSYSSQWKMDINKEQIIRIELDGEIICSKPLFLNDNLISIREKIKNEINSSFLFLCKDGNEIIDKEEEIDFLLKDIIIGNLIKLTSQSTKHPQNFIPKYAKEKEQKKDIILTEMNNFLKTKLKGQFSELNSYLRVLSENLLGRKIRISFIGYKGVGKSTVLNSIIGENIFPINEECIYRGIVIKHKNIDNFLLFKSKINEIGDGGLNKYYTFEEEEKPYCSGISNIQSYLKNISNEKSFFVIQGKLKIFDFVKFDEELIDKIEFVDLPGQDRKNNKFNKDEYYDKILQFSNCCIYIIEPKEFDDEDNIRRMQDQYIEDKLKLHYLLRSTFFNSCLFLINKSDSLSNKKEERIKDEEKLKKSIIDAISIVENISENKINISFFSGRCFFDFLQYYKTYVDILENSPLILLNNLYKKYSIDLLHKSFKEYINIEGEKMEEKLDFELEEVQIPSDFINKLKSELNQFFNENKIKSQEQEEIIKTLYSINYNIKNKDFSDTNFSLSFFKKLKEIIIYSDNIQKENLKLSIKDFFRIADILFDKELTKEIEIEKKKNEERYNLFKNNLISNTNKLLEDKENKMKQIILNGKQKSLEIIEDEINNTERRNKDNKENDIDKLLKLEQKIKNQIDIMKKEQDDIANTIIDDIINLSFENINIHYNLKSLSLDEIKVEKNKIKEIIIPNTLVEKGKFTTHIGSSIGIAGDTGFVSGGIVDGSITTGILVASTGALFGGLGLILGTGFVLVLGGISNIINKFAKTSKYKESLTSYKNQITKKFEDMLNAFEKDFEIIKNSLLKRLNILCELLYTKLDDEVIQKWEKIKSEYEIIKENIKTLIN